MVERAVSKNATTSDVRLEETRRRGKGRGGRRAFSFSPLYYRLVKMFTNRESSAE